MLVTNPADSPAGTVMIGTNNAGAEHRIDLAKAPHCLIAGQTGSGKSVVLHQIVTQLLARSPDDIGLLMVDPKWAEFAIYDDAPHLLRPVANDIDGAAELLEIATDLMEYRFSKLTGKRVRSVDAYNEQVEPAERMSRVFVVIDEFGDLMLQGRKVIEPLIVRLAQKSRAVGIHMILATQRPDATIVTGLIKANFPTRICMRVMSAVNSRIVLDQSGAEQLRNPGELILLNGGTFTKLKAPFITDVEIESRVASSARAAFNAIAAGVERTLGLGSIDAMSGPVLDAFARIVEARRSMPNAELHSVVSIPIPEHYDIESAAPARRRTVAELIGIAVVLMFVAYIAISVLPFVIAPVGLLTLLSRGRRVLFGSSTKPIG